MSYMTYNNVLLSQGSCYKADDDHFCNGFANLTRIIVSQIMKIKEFLLPEAVTSDLESSGKLDVLSELGQLLASVSPNANKDDIVAALVERERLATTGIGDGVAIPHAKSDRLTEIRGALGISRTGIPFDAVDGKPVHIFIALLAPQGVAGEHLKALARISKLVREPDFRGRLMTTQSAKELYDAIVEEDGK